ncbi:MAG: Asp-tRNA(Asn)/Glu-tRNA(Gln) amidotransferase subunit GatB [Clostridiaceae bacterium]|nr:Asp-tRNA(Asn)/Glu-tRNA(Gln) amidotransferase subunit GatB [Clostridiaceae bacterium]
MSVTDYESVIGLEVHVELKTPQKLFCGCSTTFGAPPNTQVCPVCLAMPGSLPLLNQECVEFAVRAGLALHCDIAPSSRFDRKNYFYPDLPKAYQVTQNFSPICSGGYVDVATEDGMRRIRINRIHLEEDAGKLIHHEDHSLVDCNRCGVPLIEIVTEPDIRSGEEAVAFLRKLRAIVRYTDVSDGKMNEGSLRCDVNLSVRKKGETLLGKRVEMKNINSFNFVARAIESEFKRQVALIEDGEIIVQETRRFDEKTGLTSALRKKESAADYRYFPDPDLGEVLVDNEMIAKIQSSMPRLSDERKAMYKDAYDLSDYEAERLTADKDLSDFFEAAVKETAHPKTLVSLILTDLAPLFGEDETEAPLSPETLGALADLLGKDVINSNTGRKVLKVLLENDQDPAAYVEENHLAQINDPKVLQPIVDEAVRSNIRAVNDYLKGRTPAMRALMGYIMKKTQGRANPILAEDMLKAAVADADKKSS